MSNTSEETTIPDQQQTSEEKTQHGKEQVEQERQAEIIVEKQELLDQEPALADSDSKQIPPSDFDGSTLSDLEQKSSESEVNHTTQDQEEEQHHTHEEITSKEITPQLPPVDVEDLVQEHDYEINDRLDSTQQPEKEHTVYPEEVEEVNSSTPEKEQEADDVVLEEQQDINPSEQDNDAKTVSELSSVTQHSQLGDSEVETEPSNQEEQESFDNEGTVERLDAQDKIERESGLTLSQSDQDNQGEPNTNSDEQESVENTLESAEEIGDKPVESVSDMIIEEELSKSESVSEPGHQEEEEAIEIEEGNSIVEVTEEASNIDNNEDKEIEEKTISSKNFGQEHTTEEEAITENENRNNIEALESIEDGQCNEGPIEIQENDTDNQDETMSEQDKIKETTLTEEESSREQVMDVQLDETAGESSSLQETIIAKDDYEPQHEVELAQQHDQVEDVIGMNDDNDLQSQVQDTEFQDGTELEDTDDQHQDQAEDNNSTEGTAETNGACQQQIQDESLENEIEIEGVSSAADIVEMTDGNTEQQLLDQDLEIEETESHSVQQMDKVEDNSTEGTVETTGDSQYQEEAQDESINDDMDQQLDEDGRSPAEDVIELKVNDNIQPQVQGELEKEEDQQQDQVDENSGDQSVGELREDPVEDIDSNEQIQQIDNGSASEELVDTTVKETIAVGLTTEENSSHDEVQDIIDHSNEKENDIAVTENVKVQEGECNIQQEEQEESRRSEQDFSDEVELNVENHEKEEQDQKTQPDQVEDSSIHGEIEFEVDSNLQQQVQEEVKHTGDNTESDQQLIEDQQQADPVEDIADSEQVDNDNSCEEFINVTDENQEVVQEVGDVVQNLGDVVEQEGESDEQQQDSEISEVTLHNQNEDVEVQETIENITEVENSGESPHYTDVDQQDQVDTSRTEEAIPEDQPSPDTTDSAEHHTEDELVEQEVVENQEECFAHGITELESQDLIGKDMEFEIARTEVENTLDANSSVTESRDENLLAESDQIEGIGEVSLELPHNGHDDKEQQVVEDGKETGGASIEDEIVRNSNAIEEAEPVNEEFEDIIEQEEVDKEQISNEFDDQIESMNDREVLEQEAEFEDCYGEQLENQQLELVDEQTDIPDNGYTADTYEDTMEDFEDTKEGESNEQQAAEISEITDVVNAEKLDNNGYTHAETEFGEDADTVNLVEGTQANDTDFVDNYDVVEEVERSIEDLEDATGLSLKDETSELATTDKQELDAHVQEEQDNLTEPEYVDYDPLDDDFEATQEEENPNIEDVNLFESEVVNNEQKNFDNNLADRQPDHTSSENTQEGVASSSEMTWDGITEEEVQDHTEKKHSEEEAINVTEQIVSEATEQQEMVDNQISDHNEEDNFTTESEFVDFDPLDDDFEVVQEENTEDNELDNNIEETQQNKDVPVDKIAIVEHVTDTNKTEESLQKEDSVVSTEVTQEDPFETEYDQFDDLEIQDPLDRVSEDVNQLAEVRDESNQEVKTASVPEQHIWHKTYLEACNAHGKSKPNSLLIKNLTERPESLVVHGVFDCTLYYIGNCGIKPVLDMIMQMNIHTLILTQNGLRNDGVKLVCEMAKAHPTLTTINLSGNSITLSAALSIIDLVKSNPRICSVDTSKTHIDQDFQDRIARYLERNRKENK